MNIRDKIDSFGTWYHNLNLNGVFTKKDGSTPARGENWYSITEIIPSDLTGLSVLDIGCNEGAFSLLCKERGAKYVLGIDYNKSFIERAVFAADTLGLDIDYRVMNVDNIPEIGMKFDIVLFIGVLYHLTDPFKVFKSISSVCKDLLICETASVDSSVIDTKYPIILLGNEGKKDNNHIMNKLVGHIHPNTEGLIYLGRNVGKFNQHKVIFTGRRLLIEFRKLEKK